MKALVFVKGAALSVNALSTFDGANMTMTIDESTEPSTITEEGLVERLTKVIDDCHDWQAAPREIAERVIAASGHTALLSQIGVLREALVLARKALVDTEYYSAGDLERIDAALSRPLP